MLSSDNKEAFLSLVRLGIGHHSGVRPKNIDWSEIEALATEQGLAAVVVDGVDMLPLEQRPPKQVLLQWIGETLQSYEYRYDQYCRAISDLAGFYNAHGFKMMVLKGYACSLDWLKPEHRPCGDIDIWQFGKQKEADAVLAKEKGIKVDKSHHHHTVFYWRNFMVENHYDFVNVYGHESSRELEKVFKQLGNDGSHSVEVYGERVYLPSPNLHALFLLRHMVSHFASTELNLRQILDWGFFVKTHTKEIDWKWLVCKLEKYHMRDFYNCLNAICVENLGFDISIFPKVQFGPALKERILNDTLSPEFVGPPPSGVIHRIVFKYKRWKAKDWKQRLCYKDSRLVAFWRGVWSHIVKPSSI